MGSSRWHGAGGPSPRAWGEPVCQLGQVVGQRRRLPELVRQVRKDAGASVQITVHDEVVAELRAALPEPEPGAAARKLLELMRKLPKPRGPKTHISSRVKEHLYGRGGAQR